jgi:hypothetical protein
VRELESEGPAALRRHLEEGEAAVVERAAGLIQQPRRRSLER